MKNNRSIITIGFLLTAFLFTGCTKNYTKFYDDGEDKGLAIFSNTGNNIATCFINNRPWRTMDRRTAGFANQITIYEVDIHRLQSSGVNDTLLIRWGGYYPDDDVITGDITLHFAMPANFTFSDLSAFQGQRLAINSTNGYFSADISGLNSSNEKGTGNIYFHTASFDSTSANFFQGKISGIFEANFSSVKIERGRFDHDLTSQQIHF